MRSGEEFQAALRGLVTRGQSYEGTERAEAQTFLNELFDCYGTERRDVAEFETCGHEPALARRPTRGVAELPGSWEAQRPS